jgi:hypothetical protein
MARRTEVFRCLLPTRGADVVQVSGVSRNVLSEEPLIKGVIEVGARCNQIGKNRFCFRYDPTVLRFFDDS